jgi:hypothetical protein
MVAINGTAGPAYRRCLTSLSTTSQAATNPPWRALTKSTASLSSGPKREHDTISAAAAQSMDFGFSLGSLKMGVERRDLDGASRKESGTRGASAPSWSNKPTKGFSRHQTNPTISRPSPQPMNQLLDPAGRSKPEREGTGLQIWRRGPLTPPSHRDYNPPRSCRPCDQEHPPAPTDVTSRRSTPPLHPGPPPRRPNSPE